MAFNKFAAFYAAYNTSVASGNPASKAELVRDFTNGRTCSLKDLSDDEIRQLVHCINDRTGAKYVPTSPEEVQKDGLRKAIISQFYTMHRTTAAAKAWAEKYGVNGQKKRFNQYTGGELFLLLKNAEKVVADWRASIRKNVLK
jgi:hypothetical protein